MAGSTSPMMYAGPRRPRARGIVLALLSLSLVTGAGCSARSLGYLTRGQAADGGTAPGDPDAAEMDGPFVGEPTADAAPRDAELAPDGPRTDTAPADATPSSDALSPGVDGSMDGPADTSPEGPVVDAVAPQPDGAADGSATDAGGVKTVILVVGATNLSADDRRISDRLKSLGLQVTVVDDSVVSAASAATAAGVIITRSAGTTTVGTRLRTLAKGMLVSEAGMYQNMGMVNPSSDMSWGYTMGLTDVIVQPGIGALGADLSGTVTVLSAPDDIAFGVPGPQGLLVAAVAGQARTDMGAVFAYESGAQMYDLTAPARRVGFYFSRVAPGIATPAGWALFDAAVRWIVNAP